MKVNMVNIALILAIALSWAMPVWAVVNNQIKPDYASALGVAYGFLIGCVVHIVVGLIWIAVRRSAMEPVEWIALLVSLGIMVLLFYGADGGALSKMS
jgi:hypothetical protein